MSGKYYPNKWKAIQKAPDEFFETLSFAEFIDWKFHNGLDLTPGFNCIIRAENADTGEITEHVYKQQASAERRIYNYAMDGTHDLTIATTDLVTFIPSTAFYDPTYD